MFLAVEILLFDINFLNIGSKNSQKIGFEAFSSKGYFQVPVKRRILRLVTKGLNQNMIHNRVTYLF